MTIIQQIKDDELENLNLYKLIKESLLRSKKFKDINDIYELAKQLTNDILLIN